MVSKKQWFSWYKENPQNIFEKHFSEYQNEQEYSVVYRAYKKCERALTVAIEWGEEWANKYIYDPSARMIERIKKITQKISRKIRTIIHKQVIKTNPNIDWNGFAPIDARQFYLIELQNHEKKPIWYKIGTTDRYTTERFDEHLTKQSSSYSEQNITYIKVLGLFDCGNLDPVEVESKVRTYLKKVQGEENYIKNDRFMNPFNIEDLNKKIPLVINKLQAAEIEL